jgi:hypothetical protein
MEINVTIPLTPQYFNKFVTINETTVELTIPLIDGQHRLTTDLTVVGTLKFRKDPVLQASVTLWYEYDSSERIVTFCDNDFVSPDSMFITTVPRGSAQSYDLHTHDDDHLSPAFNSGWSSAPRHRTEGKRPDHRQSTGARAHRRCPHAPADIGSRTHGEIVCRLLQGKVSGIL